MANKESVLRSLDNAFDRLMDYSNSTEKKVLSHYRKWRAEQEKNIKLQERIAQEKYFKGYNEGQIVWLYKAHDNAVYKARVIGFSKKGLFLFRNPIIDFVSAENIYLTQAEAMINVKRIEVDIDE